MRQCQRKYKNTISNMRMGYIFKILWKPSFYPYKFSFFLLLFFCVLCPLLLLSFLLVICQHMDDSLQAFCNLSLYIQINLSLSIFTDINALQSFHVVHKQVRVNKIYIYNRLMTCGKHLVLDCTGFNDNMRSTRVIQDFINDLVIYVLKMKKKGETIFEYFPNND